MPRIRWLIWTKQTQTRTENTITKPQKRTKKTKNRIAELNTETHYGVPVKNYSDAV